MIKTRRNHGLPFTVLVGNFPYGSDPSRNLPVYQNPSPIRQGVTHQILTEGDKRVSARNTVGLLDGAIANKTASLTVADNDFSTGKAIIQLGEYLITSEVDYAIGGGVNATATNIAASIDNLPRFTASPTGAQVDIGYSGGPANIVTFRVFYYGTKTNFNPISPEDGLMGNGTPNYSAVDLI